MFSFWAGLWSRTTLYFGISTCYRYNKSALKLSKRTESNRPINFGRVAFYRWTTLAKKMSRIWGSNPQPTDYKSVALPIVLIRLLTVLRTEGVEPCVFGLWDQRVNRFTRPLCITILGNILNIIVTNPHFYKKNLLKVSLYCFVGMTGNAPASYLFPKQVSINLLTPSRN